MDKKQSHNFVHHIELFCANSFKQIVGILIALPIIIIAGLADN